MATTKFYLDCRRVSEQPAKLKLAIRNFDSTAYMNTDIKLLPSQWDAKAERVVNHPQWRQLNAHLAKFKSDVDLTIFEMARERGIIKWKAQRLKHEVEARMHPKDDSDADRFLPYASKFISLKSPRTKEIYEATIARMAAFEKELGKLGFQDINIDWLRAFDAFLALSSPSKNARNIHLRNIRAIFNAAIDDEVTNCYPFRKFKIKGVATAKRSLSVEQLRQLFKAKAEPHAEKYLDAFKLIFILCGINIIDLCHLKDAVDGRAEYYRAKTHKFYSIKIEPEAQELINKHKGEKYALNFLDSFKSYKDFAKYLNKNLKLIGSIRREGRGGKKVYEPMFPSITSYWARYSWATIAASLDIPKETIAAALGHEIGSRITSIYIDFDQRKVDEANRRVLDWVLYGKK